MCSKRHRAQRCPLIERLASAALVKPRLHHLLISIPISLSVLSPLSFFLPFFSGVKKTSRRFLLQEAVQLDHTDSNAKVALETYTAELTAAYSAEVESRLAPDNVEATLKSCIDVIRIGNEGVYEVHILEI